MNKIEQWMNSRIGLNFRSGLDRMEQAVSLLGRPDKACPILHVTGTNGKGSTIAFLRQLLMAHGKKVGTFTSPHMISIHDRICMGISRFQMKILLGLAKKSNKWSRPCSKPRINSPILRLSVSWPFCILRNKEWMWSCWKSVSVDF